MKWISRTPAGTVRENATEYGANTDTNAQGAHHNALEQRHLVKTDNISDNRQGSLEEPSSSKAEKGAPEYKDGRAWSRSADDGSH